MLKSLSLILISMRPVHWIKNLLVFVPALMAHQIFDSKVLGPSLLSFFGFCSIASLGYLVNDLIDLPHDQKHPTRRFRPIASGQLSFRATLVGVILLFFLSLLFSYPLGYGALFLQITYLLLTVLYSLVLKKFVLVDTIVLACLLSGRILAGSFSTGIRASNWLIGFSLFFFLSLAILKRAVEIRRIKTKGVGGAGHGRDYQVHDEPMVTSLGLISGMFSVLILSLYINSQIGSTHYPNTDWLWGLCVLAFYWIGRLWILVGRGAVDDDPVLFVVRDRTSYLVGLLALVLVFLAI